MHGWFVFLKVTTFITLLYINTNCRDNGSTLETSRSFPFLADVKQYVVYNVRLLAGHFSCFYVIFQIEILLQDSLFKTST
jgi:hypothetical protein